MAIVDRVKNILLTPKTEWPVIATETTSTSGLMLGYVAPLAAIPAICGYVGSMLLFGMLGMSSMIGLMAAVLGYVMSFVGVFVIAFIINLLAPTFGGEKNQANAIKVAVYSFTAAWIVGVFSLIPFIGVLGSLLGLYSIYLMYVGLPVLMKAPVDKSIGYTAVVFVAAIVFYIVTGAAVAMVVAFGRPAMHLGGIGASSISGSTFDKDSKLGKLEAFGKKMEAAEKSGNKDEAAKAAIGMFGAVLGGGKSVEPLGIEQLKPFVPESFAGLAKKSSKAEKTGAMGIMVSKAEARYADDAGKSIHLEVSDTGGAAGMMAFAGWAMEQGEKEDEFGSEKTGKVGGRLVHEKTRKDGRNEYDVVIGERFIVAAKGNGVDLATLKSAVAGLDLSKLEGLKDVGVQK